MEPAFGCLGATPTEAATLCRELGFRVPSAHTPLPIGDDKNKVLDFVAAFGCKRIILGGIGEQNFTTLDLVKQNCELFNEAHAIAAENGMTFGIHNHWWEFQEVEGRYVYQVMLERLDPAIFFEIDTYWVQTAGLNPVQIVRELGPRAPLLHIKDGPAIKDEPQVAVGDGVLDVSGIVQVAQGIAEWLVVEVDRCATDMIQAIEKSYQYMVGEGLAYGNKG